MKFHLTVCRLKRFSGKNVFKLGSDHPSYFSKQFSAAVLVCELKF